MNASNLEKQIGIFRMIYNMYMTSFRLHLHILFKTGIVFMYIFLIYVIYKQSELAVYIDVTNSVFYISSNVTNKEINTVFYSTFFIFFRLKNMMQILTGR